MDCARFPRFNQSRTLSPPCVCVCTNFRFSCTIRGSRCSWIAGHNTSNHMHIWNAVSICNIIYLFASNKKAKWEKTTTHVWIIGLWWWVCLCAWNWIYVTNCQQWDMKWSYLVWEWAQMRSRLCCGMSQQNAKTTATTTATLLQAISSPSHVRLNAILGPIRYGLDLLVSVTLCVHLWLIGSTACSLLCNNAHLFTHTLLFMPL